MTFVTPQVLPALGGAVTLSGAPESLGPSQNSACHRLVTELSGMGPFPLSQCALGPESHATQPQEAQTRPATVRPGNVVMPNWLSHACPMRGHTDVFKGPQQVRMSKDL